ncbi:glycosyltransferase family 4 protein [Tropicimonas marinistellae]|uniref:glycosyltransferase family 4 protein n=1 Tax=Tropicimonas marinistellae TaxID=1739787 RepID=UPI00137327E3|nr:glycosyltransferase family 4 protein [Tropicimonas marinistellae]
MISVRAAMLTQCYLPFIGGAEKQLAAILPRLRTKGIESTVITRRLDDSPERDTVDGIPVRRLQVRGPKPVASLSYTAMCLRELHRIRPNVVHAFELRSPTLTAVAYRALTGTPVVAKVLRGGSLGDISALSRRPLDRRRLAFMLSRVDAFNVISQEIDDELAAAGVPETRRHFIPNGVDIDLYRPVGSERKAAARAALGLPSGPVALCVGRLEPEKRFLELAGIWPHIRERLPRATLAIVGTGSLETRLRAPGPDGIVVAGKTDDLLPWYAAADCFVLPSRSEGLSNALLEAMAMGLTCVATRVGAAPDLLSGGLGFLVPVGDDRALLDAIETALVASADEEFRSVEARHERIASDYSLANTTARLAALYTELAERRSPGSPR